MKFIFFLHWIYNEKIFIKSVNNPSYKSKKNIICIYSFQKLGN